jgi:hypothetical protein
MIDIKPITRFYFRVMKRLFISLGMALAVSAAWCSEPQPPAKLLTDKEIHVLPLALDDHFQFRKTRLFLDDPKYFTLTQDPTILYERERINFGAVDAIDKGARLGNYFSFAWRSTGKADITVRLEYRQENLGSYVQAQEVSYTGVKGTMKTDFKVVGDDYRQDGRVMAWRALLIENGKIVGLTASYLWD